MRRLPKEQRSQNPKRIPSHRNLCKKIPFTADESQSGGPKAPIFLYFQVLCSRSSALVHPPPPVDPSPATIPAARHVPSTSPTNRSLALTPALLIPSAPLPIVNRPTLCTNSNVKNVMHFTLEKWVRCSQNL